MSTLLPPCKCVLIGSLQPFDVLYLIVVVFLQVHYDILYKID
jgi:hypothetical protein